MKKRRHIAIYLCTILVLLNQSCSSINNRLDDNVLNCGAEFDKKTDYFIVMAPDGRRLNKNELEIIDLESGKKYSNLSSRGCVSTPLKGQFLIHSKIGNWSQVINAESTITGGVVNLYDFSGEHITVACNKDKPTTVSNDLQLNSILISNVADSLKKSFQIDLDITDRNKTFRSQRTIPFAELTDEFKPFYKDFKEGLFDLKITIKNLAQNKSESVTICPFLIDQTPPEAVFSVNQREVTQKTKIHSAKQVALITPNDEISFISNDRDTKTVTYCLRNLDDNFEERDSVKSKDFENLAFSLSCEGERTIQSALNSPIPLPSKQGIWSIRYYANDQLGNQSVVRNQIFHLNHKETLDFINQTALVSVKNALYERETLRATSESLKAYKLFKTLPTRFERQSASPSVLAGLLEVTKKNAIDLNREKKTSDIYLFKVTPDGKRIVGLHENGSIGIWDNRSMKLIKSFGEVWGTGTAIALSNDESKIFILTHASTLAVWDLERGKVINSIDDMLPGAVAMMLSHDEKKLVLGTFNGLIQIRDAESLKVIKDVNEDFNSQTGMKRISSIDIDSNDERFAVSSRSTGEIKLFSLNDGSLIKSFVGHSSGVDYIKFSHDGRSIFSVSTDNTARKWDIQSGKEIHQVTSSFTSSLDDEPNANIFTQSSETDTNLIPVSLSPDEKSFVLGMGKGRVDVIDIESGGITLSYESGHRAIQNVEVGADGRTIYAKPNSNHILKLSLQRNLSERVMRPSTPDKLESVAINVRPNGEINYYNSSGIFRTWSPNGSLLKESEINLTVSHDNVLLSPDSSKIMSNSMLGIEIFDYFKQSMIIRFKPPTTDYAFAPDSRSFVTFDGTKMNVRNAETGEMLRAVETTTEPLYTSFSPDGKSILVVTKNTVDLYDTKSLILLHQYSNIQDSYPIRASVSDNASRVIGGGDSASIWDLDSERLLVRFNDEEEGFYRASFSKDTTTVVTLGKKSTIKIWNATTGDLLTTLFKLDRTPKDSKGFGPSLLAAFELSTDGKTIAYADVQGTVKVFDFDIESLRSKLCERVKDYVEEGLCQ
ncbi:MAG: hypothetical protein EOP07_04220 [Proteobacteria bacterium]|nr:MAG: hypothetical protein EOP07_04220 [Pseudomonadota bacterium]